MASRMCSRLLTRAFMPGVDSPKGSENKARIDHHNGGWGGGGGGGGGGRGGGGGGWGGGRRVECGEITVLRLLTVGREAVQSTKVTKQILKRKGS